MKISKKILQLLHEQIGIEANASNYYLYVSSWCKVNGYDGASSFFQNHSTEERDHMLKIIQYLNDLKIHTVIPSIEKPKQNSNEPLNLFCIVFSAPENIERYPGTNGNTQGEKKDSIPKTNDRKIFTSID